MTRRNSPLAVALFALHLCNVQAQPLAAELRSLSNTAGLGLIRFVGMSELEIIYFDGRRGKLNLPGLDGVYDIEPHTQAILGSNKGLLQALRKDGITAVTTASFALFSLDGRLSKPVGHPLWPILIVLAPDLNSMAVLSYAGAKQVSLQYGPLDWSSTQDVYSVDISGESDYRGENFSWSPDQRSLAYSVKERVYIWIMAARSSRSVGEGADPCWSPNGRSIVYRSKSRDLMLYDVSTGITHQLTHWFKVIGFPRWSPDSKFIFFTESNPFLALRNPATMPATEFMVIRISDGATTSVFTPGMGQDNRRFYWIRH